MKKSNKVGTVMREFKSGDLKSSSGTKVTNPKQAMAIALSEAGVSKKGKNMKADGVAKKGKTKADMVKMAKGGACKPKKYMMGGMAENSNRDGGMRGLDRAAAMSGRDMSGMGRPAVMKKGGVVKKAKGGGCEVRGKTKGKMVKM
jgi:hypothetical protein